MATQVDLILHNAQYVVVADAKASVLRNVSIAIKDEKIFGIVPINQENQWQSSKVIDCSHKSLYTIPLHRNQKNTDNL